MFDRNIRRLVGAVSAVVVAAGFAVTVGAGAAGAASQTKSWTDGNSKFTRTISNATPHAGDTITSTTKFERTASVMEFIYWVKDWHPACLTVQSARVGSNPDGYDSFNSYGIDSKGDDWAKVNGNLTKWSVNSPTLSGRPTLPSFRAFEFTYKVGADCARDVPLDTGMSYKGSLGSGTYKTKGPAVTVQKDRPVISLSAADDVPFTQSVTLTATVTDSAEVDKIDFYDGNTKIGTGALNKGVATFDWTPDTPGPHSLTAKYVGNSRAESTQSSVQTVQVSDAETTTVLTGPETADIGTESAFTAQISPAPDGGTVQFKDGGTDLGTPVPVDGDGTASMTHSFDSEGTHNIIAVYLGTDGFAGSTSTGLPVPVSEAETTAMLTPPASAARGAAVDLVAQITPATGGGTVQFKDGGTNLGSPVPVNGDGKASITHTFRSAGAHDITAVYSGTLGHRGSTSRPVTITVTNGGADDGGTGSPGNIFGS
ncbi:Ig-like domain-containing protein [Rhodococcus marinonascens]|uniref:Ig-like domain-containing protein n=1 Tax=Rhodococcus marinonascens TaxID=38311 RepID=UPI00093472CC|nr:Ig-like domain-containing protein [Rhodococcus marinonascens]